MEWQEGWTLMQSSSFVLFRVFQLSSSSWSASYRFWAVSAENHLTNTCNNSNWKVCFVRRCKNMCPGFSMNGSALLLPQSALRCIDTPSNFEGWSTKSGHISAAPKQSAVSERMTGAAMCRLSSSEITARFLAAVGIHNKINKITL